MSNSSFTVLADKRHVTSLVIYEFEVGGTIALGFDVTFTRSFMNHSLTGTANEFNNNEFILNFENADNEKFDISIKSNVDYLSTVLNHQGYETLVQFCKPSSPTMRIYKMDRIMGPQSEAVYRSKRLSIRSNIKAHFALLKDGL